MPVYSVNRRRAIILLVLTSVLLLTLDFRGNPVVDRARAAFSWVLTPFVTAGDVIANPIKNIWHGATDYQDIQRENEELREQLAQQRGDQLAARAIYSDYQELLTLNGLIANYPRVTARVVGERTSNFRQTVDIDRGSGDGIQTGMAVINSAGLVGKIHKVYPDRSVVVLVTDQEYTIECKVSGSDPAPIPEPVDPPQATTPSGENPDDLATTTTTAPTTTTTVADPDASPDDQPIPGLPGSSTTSTTTTSTTTTAPPVPVERETGGCTGRGADALPVMKFVTENPRFGSIDVGDVIETAGGAKSLAPPGIIIGEVINKIERASSAGPLLEIDLSADLDHLSLVQIVIYRPTLEIPG